MSWSGSPTDAARDVADGVWSLHFIEPGAHRTMRFSAPGKLADFAAVRQQKITADIEEAFGRPPAPAPRPLSSVEMAAVSAYREAVAKDGNARPRATPVSAVIKDNGEAAYRYQPAVPQLSAESIAAAAFDEAILKYVLATSNIIPAAPAVVGDPGEPAFRNDFPDPWQAVLTPQESAVSPGPRPSFVRFFPEEKHPLYQ